MTTVFGLHADCNLNWATNIKYVILNVSSAYYAREDSHQNRKSKISLFCLLSFQHFTWN